jgi:lysozyme
MKASQDCLELVKKFEGLKLEAYLCPAKVPTIGYGSTFYPDGQKVKLGQKISLGKAEELLLWELNEVASQIRVALPQNKFDALVSFAYNLGVGNLKKSTLFQKVLANHNDPTIKDEFMKWTKARVNGELVVLKGLVKRREAESNLYFKI